MVQIEPEGTTPPYMLGKQIQSFPVLLFYFLSYYLFCSSSSANAYMLMYRMVDAKKNDCEHTQPILNHNINPLSPPVLTLSPLQC